MFQTQVQLQCEFVLLAASELDAGVKAGDLTRTFFAVQNLLNAAANTGKALWGQGGNLAAERQRLRDSLGVTEQSPLRSVVMRNHFEHFDERLDRWSAESKARNSADLMVGTRIEAFDEIDRFRMYNPDTMEVAFWGQTFDLKVIVDEVVRILPTAQAEAIKPFWDTQGRWPF